jgi:hypothetical protein
VLRAVFAALYFQQPELSAGVRVPSPSMLMVWQAATSCNCVPVAVAVTFQDVAIDPVVPAVTVSV